MSKKTDKAYEDGFRDGQHGGKVNPPNDESWTSLFMSNDALEENAEYRKGHAAGSSSKRK